MGTTLKRYMMPKFWKAPVKTNAFIVKPRPGPHRKGECIPLQIILRDMLKVAQTAKEVRQILNAEKVVVDKKVRKDPKYPVGLMDVVEMPGISKFYRAVVSTKGLCLEDIKEEEAARKLCRITGKTTIRGGFTQLNLHDGRNIILKKDAYGVGDSLLIQLPDQKILKHFKLEKGEQAQIISGKNMGTKGKISDIDRRKTMLEMSTAVIKSGEKDIETLLDYIMVGEA